MAHIFADEPDVPMPSGGGDEHRMSQEVANANLAKDLAEQLSRAFEARINYFSLPWYGTVGVMTQAVRLFRDSHGGVDVSIDWDAAEFRFTSTRR